jgi:hypothetical protein
MLCDDVVFVLTAGICGLSMDDELGPATNICYWGWFAAVVRPTENTTPDKVTRGAPF